MEMESVLEGFEVYTNRLCKFGVFGDYKDVPAVVINETGFTMSARFCETFGFKPGPVVVMYNDKTGQVAFKVATNQAEQMASYKFSAIGKSGKSGKEKTKNGQWVSCNLACTSFIQRKVDKLYHKKLYKAAMVPGSAGIVVIQLDSPIA
jgi:hypothetical protein